ncbi:hypothetical protein [Lactococcus petauri]|uniref:hypothetical protein n=1 Tax=Lactococcus petauri TaxID=1940789 RepID=UPI0018A94496|nr:hypothetical protein [Lactococcus petauri]
MIVIPIFDFVIAFTVSIIACVIAGGALVGIRLDKVTRERDAAWRQIERMRNEKIL